MKKSLKQTLKQIISCIIGIPAAIVTCSETEDEYWYVPFLAIAVVLGILGWNHIINFNKGE